MQFDSTVGSYLRGEDFSNGLSVRIAPGREPVVDRLTAVERMAAGKRIIHVGCCDHVPLIAKKRLAGQWLHGRLHDVAARCYGIDTSEEGVRLMRDDLGYDDVACADITQADIPAIAGEQWDYLILGELLEHLDDPVGFLAAIRARYAGTVTRLLITVPNALSLLNFRQALKHRELINTDHRHWLSPYTLGRMLTSAGYEPEEFTFCEMFPAARGWRARVRPREIATAFLLRRYPALREGLIMSARL